MEGRSSAVPLAFSAVLIPSCDAPILDDLRLITELTKVDLATSAKALRAGYSHAWAAIIASAIGSIVNRVEEAEFGLEVAQRRVPVGWAQHVCAGLKDGLGRKPRKVREDALTHEQLEERFDLDYHFKQVDTIFERVFG